MIVSLNLPDDLIAFIDQEATAKKLSRSAWVAGLLANIRLVESPAGQKAPANSLQSVMAHGALRAGQSAERVRQLFPEFEYPLLVDEPASAPRVLQLPAGTDAPSPLPAPEVLAVTRRRPYQRGGSHR